VSLGEIMTTTMPMFDREWFENEVIGTMMDECYEEIEIVDFSVILERVFTGIFNRYFPTTERILQVQAEYCSNSNTSLYEYLYTRIVSECLNRFSDILYYSEDKFINEAVQILDHIFDGEINSIKYIVFHMLKAYNYYEFWITETYYEDYRSYDYHGNYICHELSDILESKIVDIYMCDKLSEADTDIEDE